ncbi:hypothetical protein Halha_2633 [Halobacteroides halobius DSM 5150]|uniref:Putative membrane protein insertion efficiency factor n=1 Tax=Halobacteroides halobius (strain ATCC 35273 / DSM 5150 / MD-1) TaxID=748449 RepID=L0KD83_HALHC|nr:membrane protein insertion efficiency factor YidD [Halobacteroides halobius]AGB42505.1 hypothetical protein Halha_2633 [Halobacteroides halobius DSM 5150]
MKLVTKSLIKLVKLYQKFISPLKPRSSCRFRPTCSTYSIHALEKYGLFKGSWISLKRILKCHPFHPGGYDPVD